MENTTCHICNWTTANLLNLGNPNEEQKWTCHGCIKKVFDRMNSGAPSGIELQVCEDITERQLKGVKKYGSTVAENPLTLPQWLNHAYEEALDFAIYLKRAGDFNSTTLAGPGLTPNAKLPPIGGPLRRKIVIEVEVPADFESRLDNQWTVEREIHADRWNWNWKA